MRVYVIAVAATIFGLTGTSLANSLDSPGTVYIDGVACNLACQAYMDWSRRTLKANQPAARGTADVSDVKRPAPRKRVARHFEPTSSDKPQRKKAGDTQATLSARPEPAPLPVPRSVPPAGEAAAAKAATPSDPESNTVGDVQAALSSKSELTAPSESKSVSPGRESPATTAAIAADPTPPPVPAPPSGGNARTDETINPPAAEKTPQELVMAALAVVEQMTSVAPSPVAGDDKFKPDPATVPSAQVADNLVALLIAGPDVTSAAALKDRNVAIDKATGHEADIRFALIAAGATGAELSATDDSAIDRVVRGDVQAAVVKLVSPEAAAAFPDVKDLNVLRVPLTPR